MNRLSHVPSPPIPHPPLLQQLQINSTDDTNYIGCVHGRLLPGAAPEMLMLLVGCGDAQGFLRSLCSSRDKQTRARDGGTPHQGAYLFLLILRFVCSHLIFLFMLCFFPFCFHVICMFLFFSCVLFMFICLLLFFYIFSFSIIVF